MKKLFGKRLIEGLMLSEDNIDLDHKDDKLWRWMVHEVRLKSSSLSGFILMVMNVST